MAEEWADRGTGRAVRGRDSDLEVEGDRAAELVVEEPEAPAVQGAAVAPACGILACQAALAAKAPV